MLCMVRAPPILVLGRFILEMYNVLFWSYRARPLRNLLEKLGLTVSELKVAGTSIMDLNASLIDNNVPIVVSNDPYMANKARSMT